MIREKKRINKTYDVKQRVQEKRRKKTSIRFRNLMRISQVFMMYTPGFTVILCVLVYLFIFFLLLESHKLIRL